MPIIVAALLGFFAGNQQAKFVPTQNDSYQANEEQEFATYVIGGGTLLVLFFQCVIFARQETVMAKQTEISRRSHIQTLRPRLRVRNVVVKDKFAKGRSVGGQFYVDNIGGTDATVVESYCCISWNLGGLPMERPYEGHGKGHEINDPIRGGTVIAGSVGITAIFDTFPTVYPASMEPPGTSSDNRAFFMGWIEYTDELGIRHRTAFCREFRQIEGSARFYPTNDPDYEHEG